MRQNTLRSVYNIDVGKTPPDGQMQFCREALVWRQLRHEHILPFLGVDRDTFKSLLCMVAPWLYHGDIIHCMNTLEEQGEVIPFRRWVSRATIHGINSDLACRSWRLRKA